MGIEDVCVERIRAMRKAFVNDRELQCRNCASPEFCERYKPISETQESYRRGANAYVLAGIKL